MLPFLKTYHELSESEARVVARLKQRKHVSRDTNQQFDETLTFGQRAADHIASFGGSWTFIGIFTGVIVGWVILNSILLVRHGKSFDPYPYILLNLMLSMLAALQAPVIMMSQNRLAAKDRLQAEHDYEVNLKAEMEILELHHKLDALREVQWDALVTMQQEQIHLLTLLLQTQSAAHVPTDPLVAPMVQTMISKSVSTQSNRIRNGVAGLKPARAGLRPASHLCRNSRAHCARLKKRDRVQKPARAGQMPLM